MVRVYNEWSALIEVVLGDATNIYPARPGSVVPSCFVPVWARTLEHMLYAVRRRRPVPQFVRWHYYRELAVLERVLHDHGIAVSRPTPIEPMQDDPPGLSQVFPRDPAIVVGEKVVLARQRAEPLRKQIRGFAHLLTRLRAEGVTIVDSRTEDDVFLGGGDVLVDYPYVFAGVGERASNAAGVQWLQKTLGSSHQVIPVNLRDSRAFHLDTCLSIIGPRTAIVHQPALQWPLPPPLNEYTLIPVDARTYREVGVNVLVIRPHRLVVQARHRRGLGRTLEEHGFEVIPVVFDWHALAGGGFRCATCPILRA